MRLKALTYLFSAALCYAATAWTPAVAQQNFITIGTGGQTGVYYVVGQSICRLVNRGTDSHGLRCNAPSSGGSVANVNAIRGGMYRGNDSDVETFGVRATMVTSARVSEEAVYQTVKAVFDNFDRFKRLHPAFAELKEEEMIKEGLSIPLHDGAVRYYRERGWM